MNRRAAADRAGPPWGAFDLASLALLLTLALVAAATLGDYAASNDELVQQRYGEMIVAYYASGFTDRALFSYLNLYLYGGLFDIAAWAIEAVLPFDIYATRHILCVAIGLAGLAGVWAAARLVAGPRAALLAALLLATTGVWYGAMFNHTKDIPFAAAMIWATVFVLRIQRTLPRPPWRDVAGFGLMLGAAWGQRATGLLLVGYVGLAGLAHLALVWRRSAQAWRMFATMAARLAPGVLLGYAITLAVWPWAALSPMNPIRAIFAFAHFNYGIQTLLAGASYSMAEVPRWYIPAYLAIKLPLLLIAGAAVSAPAALRMDRAQRSAVALLWFVALFPVACQVIAQGPAFTGMRHFMFVVPPLAALAGIGLDGVLRRLAKRWSLAPVAAAAVVVAGVAWQAAALVRLHPYQYLDYNALVGGVAGANGRYDMDYWVNIMPEAVARLRAYVKADPNVAPDARFTVGVCGERFSFEREAGPHFIWTDGWYEADFFIAPTGENCDRATNGNPVIRIERMGALIGVVKDRRGYRSPSGAGGDP